MAEMKTLKELRNGRRKEDSVAFDLVTTDEETIPLRTTPMGLQMMVRWLIALGQSSEQKSPMPERKETEQPERVELAPIEAIELGIAQPRTPNEVTLVFELGDDFRLGFHLEASKLHKLKSVIDQMIPTEAPKPH